MLDVPVFQAPFVAPFQALSAPGALGSSGGVRPPAVHVWLRGKTDDGSSYVTLRGLVAASTYVSLSAKAS